jgi:hypothetical protein
MNQSLAHFIFFAETHHRILDLGHNTHRKALSNPTSFVSHKAESKSSVGIMLIKRFLIFSVLPQSASPFAHLFSRQIFASSLIMSANGQEYHRKDGVKITHDPYAPGMADQYGLPGNTDPDGFDPYADTVGPGIYGGSVKRDEEGNVVIGEQYQNHNQVPGPGTYDPESHLTFDSFELFPNHAPLFSFS